MSKVIKFVIDAGHYPHTSGKRSPHDIMREYTFNSHVAIHIMNILKGYENVECHFVHRDDRDVPLAERVRVANNLKADAYISIHANAHGDGRSFTSAEGIETFVGSSASATSRKLANAVHSRLLKIANQRDRGVKTNNFYVVNPKYNKVPSILIECGFMTNEKELALLMNVDYKIGVAYAIVDALVEVFGIKSIHKPVEVNQPAPTPIPTADSNYHTVVKNDTLWSLSRKYDVAINELIKINGLKDNVLAIGQKIYFNPSIPTPQPVVAPQPAPQPRPVVNTPAPQPSSSKIKYTRVLKKGMKGEDVRALQKALNSLNFKVGSADGDFGEKTRNAVTRFQKVYLPREVDGIAGKNTINKINSLLK